MSCINTYFEKKNEKSLEVKMRLKKSAIELSLAKLNRNIKNIQVKRNEITESIEKNSTNTNDVELKNTLITQYDKNLSCLFEDQKTLNLAILELDNLISNRITNNAMKTVGEAFELLNDRTDINEILSDNIKIKAERNMAITDSKIMRDSRNGIYSDAIDEKQKELIDDMTNMNFNKSNNIPISSTILTPPTPTTTTTKTPTPTTTQSVKKSIIVPIYDPSFTDRCGIDEEDLEGLDSTLSDIYNKQDKEEEKKEEKEEEEREQEEEEKQKNNKVKIPLLS
jgi:hypothetical protein